MGRQPFAEELLAAMPTAQARLACLNVLARWAGSSVYLPAQSKCERRERAAAHMLQNDMDRGEVVSALRERFGVSQRTAWRDVANSSRHLTRSDGITG